MTDLRALLGGRYVSTMRAAVLADNPEAITNAQRVGGKLGQLMYLSAVNRLDRTLAAILPDLLADAWDEGHADGLHNAHEHREHRKARNPYRPETTAGRPEPAPGPTNSPNPTPSATQPLTEPRNTEGESR